MLTKFNDWLANILADWLSTMAMFYAVGFLVLSILFFQMPKTPLDWVQYIVQAFFQGVALPVLAFVAKKEGTKTERILQETHDTVMAELALAREERDELRQIISQDSDIDRLVAGIMAQVLKLQKGGDIDR